MQSKPEGGKTDSDNGGLSIPHKDHTWRLSLSIEIMFQLRTFAKLFNILENIFAYYIVSSWKNFVMSKIDLLIPILEKGEEKVEEEGDKEGEEEEEEKEQKRKQETGSLRLSDLPNVTQIPL